LESKKKCERFTPSPFSDFDVDFASDSNIELLDYLSDGDVTKYVSIRLQPVEYVYEAVYRKRIKRLNEAFEVASY
jgi:hypothetical protein